MPIIAFPDQCSFKLKANAEALSGLGKARGRRFTIFAAREEGCDE
jgi:hypothetical protein